MKNRDLIAVLLATSLVTSGVVAKEQIGRLFITAAERTELDMLRSGIKQPTPEREIEIVEEVTEPEFQPPREPVHLNGLIQRSDGRTTVWVNGQRLDRGDSIDGLTLEGDANGQNRIRLRIDADQQSVQLKPGQTWDPAMAQLIEHHQLAAPKPETEQETETLQGGNEPVVMDGP